MSDTRPWTEAMMKALDDGAWHDREEILLIGAALVPEERAMEEMGSRSLTSTPERRVAAGARTVALQALQGRRRFLAVEFTKDKSTAVSVRKTDHDGVANFGASVERIARLEEELGALRALVSQIAARVGFEEEVLTESSDASVVIDLMDHVNGK